MSPDVGFSERTTPHSRDAERCLLGSMLRDNAVIGDVLQIVRQENFYFDAHQKIFQGITALYDKANPVDLVTLAEWLREQKYVEDIGGYAYLGELWEAAPTAANAEYYAKIVRDKAIVRNLITAGTEILRDAYDQTQPADELLESSERKILDVAQLGITGQTATLVEAMGEAFDRIDARTQNNYAEAGLPTGYLDIDEMTAGLHNNELIILAARPSVGKCLAHDSEILLADGSLATIEEVHQRRAARLLTLGTDWQFRWTSPSDFVDDGVKAVYRVTTRLGRRIETTLSHPFLTIDGWKPLAALRAGERVAVPRRLGVFGREPLRDCEVKLLAYLIGDGGLTDSAPEFTNSNPRLRAEFTAAVAEFAAGERDRGGERGPARQSRLLCFSPGGAAVVSQGRQPLVHDPIMGLSPGGAIVTVAPPGLGASSGARFQGLTPLANNGRPSGANSPAAARLEAPGFGRPRTVRPGGWSLRPWLERLGLWGKGARAKFVPAPVFRLPRPQLALFLNRLFATDGWATVLGGGQTQLGYATVSERLARQLQHLLLRFGIIASLRERAVLYRGARRPCWQLDITDARSIHTFLDEICIFGKEEATDRVRQSLDGRRYQTNRDLIPVAVWDRLATAKGKVSWSELARRAGLPDHTNIHVHTRALSRARLARFADALDDPSLRQLADSAVYWDEIVAIEPAGAKQVYDLTIPGTHNFVANDVCVHNTAFSLNVVRNIIVGDPVRGVPPAPVFFVSLEQSRIELAERLLCAQARVDSHKLRKGHLSSDDMDKLIKAGDVLRQARLFIDDSPAQGMLRIAANARRLKKRHDIRLVVIDYLQLIDPDNKRDSRQEQVAQISRRLKFLARELKVPVMALAQVNRSSEDRQDHKPRLADLRESGSIEQDADTVLLLHRPGKYEGGGEDNVIEVLIAKQRNGPTGDVTLAYIKQYMRYENYAVGGPGTFGD